MMPSSNLPEMETSKTMLRDDMMASWMERAVELNNEGVSSLCSGHHEKGIARLSRSLSLLRQLIVMRQADCEASRSEGHSSSNNENIETMTVIPNHLPLEDLRDPNYFVYNRCMVIPRCKEARSPHVPLYSACILLNLAMGYHQSRRKGRRGFSLLLKSKKMTQMTV
jgi:hypothetical protein